MIKQWITSQNKALKNPYINNDQNTGVRSIRDVKPNEIFRVVTLENEYILKEGDSLPDPPFFRLLHTKEIVDLWNNLKYFKYYTGTQKIGKDAYLGRCTAAEIWQEIFKQLVNVEEQYGDDLFQLMKRQTTALNGLWNRFKGARAEIITTQKDARLNIFMKQVYQIDINTPEGENQLNSLRETVAPYVESCCDKFGRLSPFAVAFQNDLNAYFQQIYDKIQEERAEARKMKYPEADTMNVFRNIQVADVAEHILKAVSDANTFLSSIQVGNKLLKNLNNLSDGKGNCIKSLTQLRMEVGDKCRGLSYFAAPKSFLNDFMHIITNYKNKSMPNGSKGVTVIDLINVYNNILLASTSDNVGTKYYNGVKASVYKYPPKRVTELQNNPGEGGPKDQQHNPLTQINKDNAFSNNPNNPTNPDTEEE